MDSLVATQRPVGKLSWGRKNTIDMESISSQVSKLKDALNYQFEACMKDLKDTLLDELVTAVLDQLSFSVKGNPLELEDLQKMVQKSRSDVQCHLNLGWIGVCEILAVRGLGMDHLMDLWQGFLSFLRLLQYFCLKLEEILALWEKALYLLLLYLSFSEFPNRLRPPCTTMPWTIWPALVVLWGVCWMFWDNWAWGEQGELPEAGSTNDLFENNDSTDLLEGFDPNFDDFSFENIGSGMPISNASYFDLPNFEEQLQLGVFGPGIMSEIATSLDSIPTLLAVNPADTTSLPFMSHGDTSGTVVIPSFSSDPATSLMSKAIEDRQLEATESRTPVPLTALVHRQPRNAQAAPSRNSKHSQTEKHFCPYPDCIHSQPGAGFKRKDHLDQHLRGLHKQTSVQRLRAKPAVAASTSNPAGVISDTTALSSSSSHSKKRKRSSEEEETIGSSLGQLEKELAEERRLRRGVEEENRLLRQKLENYEGRMEKYEARLDRMMSLLKEA